MAVAPNTPPRHNRRLRDYAKLERGKDVFIKIDFGVGLHMLTDAALSDALYYAGDAVTGAVGTNKIRKAIRAEAKKRGLPIP